MKVKQFLSITVLVLSTCALCTGCNPAELLHTGASRPAVMRVVLRVRPAPGQAVTKETVDNVILVIRRRATSLGVSEAVVQKKGTDQIIVELPEVRDKALALEMLQKTGSLEFYYLKDVQTERKPYSRFRMEVLDQEKYQFTDTRNPAASPITDSKEIMRRVMGKAAKPLWTGKDLVPGKASVRENSSGGGAQVAIQFQDKAAREFRDFTATHIHELIAITLDGVIMTAPSIREAISGGNPVITGNFTTEEAQDLANLLNAGSLPTPVDLLRVEPIK